MVAISRNGRARISHSATLRRGASNRPALGPDAPLADAFAMLDRPQPRRVRQTGIEYGTPSPPAERRLDAASGDRQFVPQEDLVGQRCRPRLHPFCTRGEIGREHTADEHTNQAKRRRQPIHETRPSSTGQSARRSPCSRAASAAVCGSGDWPMDLVIRANRSTPTRASLRSEASPNWRTPIPRWSAIRRSRPFGRGNSPSSPVSAPCRPVYQRLWRCVC